ncbi:MAG: Rrf2 family transcriptional regulator [Rubrivivax sp.]|nr:Rrf2 family transcriptional regulator [Rubrivivax sp.]
MKLTTLTDYALRLLMHVALHPGRLCTIAEIARRYDISEAHLVKVTHLLARAGLLHTQRGTGGGMRLARPAAEIPIGEVVRCTESGFDLVECFTTGVACTGAGTCGLAGAFDAALAAFLAELDRRSLADVLPASQRPGRVPAAVLLQRRAVAAQPAPRA